MSAVLHQRRVHRRPSYTAHHNVLQGTFRAPTRAHTDPWVTRTCVFLSAHTRTRRRLPNSLSDPHILVVAPELLTSVRRRRWDWDAGCFASVRALAPTDVGLHRFLLPIQVGSGSPGCKDGGGLLVKALLRALSDPLLPLTGRVLFLTQAPTHLSPSYAVKKSAFPGTSLAMVAPRPRVRPRTRPSSDTAWGAEGVQDSKGCKRRGIFKRGMSNIHETQRNQKHQKHIQAEAITPNGKPVLTSPVSLCATGPTCLSTRMGPPAKTALPCCMRHCEGGRGTRHGGWDGCNLHPRASASGAHSS